MKILDYFIPYGIETEEDHKTVENALKYKSSFRGSCSGSKPALTKNIREFLDGQTHS